MKYCPICTTEYEGSQDRCASDGARLIDRDQWAPGTVIRAKYRILAVIGRGGMGIVYKAEHLVFKDLWALKVMNPRLSQEPEFVRRFYFEAEKQRRLKHRNVVRVDDVDQSEDGRLFIGMEFIEGMPLREMLRAAQGPLAVPLALGIVRGVAEALEAADALGIVHRDIKPDNILLERAHQAYIPKLTDFGVAKLREGTATVSKAPLLTPQYAAPEQWQPQLGAPDGRTDLYALGMTAYELLAGRPPFQGSADHELMQAHLQQTPLPPSDFNPELLQWPGLDDLVLRLLEKSPDRRPRDARELLTDLGRIEVHTTTQSVTQPWREQNTVMRDATAVAPARVPTPARISGPVRPVTAPPVLEPPRRGEGRYEDAAPAPRTSGARPWLLAALVLVLILGGAYAYLASQHRLPSWAGGAAQAVATPPAPTPVVVKHTPAAVTSPPVTKPSSPATAPATPAAPPPAAEPAKEEYELASAGHLRQADAVHGLAFVSNSVLAVSTAAPAVRFLNLPSFEVRDIATAGDFRALAFNRAGSRLAGGDTDGTLQLWSSTGVASAPILSAQGGSILNAVAFNPSGSKLATGSADGAIRIWDVNADGAHKSNTNLQTSGEVHSLAFSPDGTQMAAAAGAQVLLYSTGGWSAAPLSGVSAAPWTLSFSPDRAWLAAGLADGTVLLWRLPGARSAPKVLQVPGGSRVNCLVFSRDSRQVVAGAADGSVLRWDVEHADAPELLAAHHTGNVWAVALSPDGRWLVTGGQDHFLEILQLVKP